jgi:hypothetical protein
MRHSSLKFWLLAALLAVTARSVAQKPSAESTDTPQGFSEFESFQGSLNSGQSVLKLDSTLGWDFNRHFGVFGGLPLYFAHLSSTTTPGGRTIPGVSHDGIGNAYMGFAFRAPNPTIGYAGALTFAAPTGDSKKGLSTGRATFDWDNRLEHSFNRFTPYFDGGLGNTVPDSTLLTRPFTSLGMVTHLEEGGGYQLFRHFSVNGAGYEIVPFGNQKVFSKLVAPGQIARGSGGHGRVFEVVHEASANGLTRENGFSTWVGFQPASVWDVELGYTRSVTFALNSFAFNLRLNVAKLFRSRSSS